MTHYKRRHFLTLTASAAAATMTIPATIRKALAIAPQQTSGTIDDVQHVVILMQENRSFDHYFGTYRGARGFGDRFTIPMASGQTVWHQSDGKKNILPFHLNTKTTKGMRVPMTPHTWPDAQSAWDLGRFGYWPKFKEFQSMGYYRQDDIPFQFALAEAFTLCDANHCAIQTGTTPNRMVLMSGTNFAPGMTRPARSQAQAMIDNSNNLGKQNGLYQWTTYPERLSQAGVSWRIYQNQTDLQENPPNNLDIGKLDNWGGLCAPWESFKQYQEAKPESALYQNAMSAWSLQDLEQHVIEDRLPQVSWIIPPPNWSEHPHASSPLQGAGYTQRVLDTLLKNPKVWSKTVLIVTFDENDGLFDHMPPPTVPAYNQDGTLAGATTLPASAISGQYFQNAINGVSATRPYGLGPRVPMYVVSPWSRGGWINSQVFDHTSVIRFLEQRFKVIEPNISAWHRAVCGDLTSCFDFTKPDATTTVDLPSMRAATGKTLRLPHRLAAVALPVQADLPQQRRGTRPARALPYELHVHLQENPQAQKLTLQFQNSGHAGAVFHVYDKLHLDRIPRRYTVEGGKTLEDFWLTAADQSRYDLWILGPNGFHRHFHGVQQPQLEVAPRISISYQVARDAIQIQVNNLDGPAGSFTITDHAYDQQAQPQMLHVVANSTGTHNWSLAKSSYWYDFSVSGDRFTQRFAGKMENGNAGISDPAMGW